MRCFRLVIPKLPVTAMALFPFVLFDHPSRLSDPVLLRHERIHLRQQMELLLVPFYLLYLYYYLKARLKGMSARSAYRAIPFEQEAYSRDGDPDYLKERAPFAWIDYRK